MDAGLSFMAGGSILQDGETGIGSEAYWLIWKNGNVEMDKSAGAAAGVAAATEQEKQPTPALLRGRLSPPPTRWQLILKPSRFDRRAVALVKPAIQITCRVLQKRLIQTLGVFLVEALMDF